MSVQETVAPWHAQLSGPALLHTSTQLITGQEKPTRSGENPSHATYKPPATVQLLPVVMLMPLFPHL